MKAKRSLRKKTHNGELALDAKIELRENVLAEIPQARVFDGFCGPSGEMHRSVWNRASSYLGVDTAWLQSDTRRRFVCECSLVLRSIDLQPFDVFDFDAFGSPWSEALILAARRKWAPGERGALVLTDGSANKMKFGPFGAMQQLVGKAHHKSLREPMRRAAVMAWCRRAGVTPERVWTARGYSSQIGGMEMFYVAVVFHGATRAAAASSAS